MSNETQEMVTKSVAIACAYQMSRFSDKIIEVRQVNFNGGFIYCERGASKEGDISVAFQSGRIVK